MTDERMQLWAPAKINLSFRILGRRPDAFHEIDTLMAPISLRDRLTFAYEKGAPTVHFRCDDLSLPSGPENLVVRAAELFLRATGARARLTIELEKQIPHGAGLGGGSSDAAATLLGLNQILETDLDETTLFELAAQLGADVPFFISRSAAVCRGRGDIVRRATLPRVFDLLLVKPAFAVATPEAYALWKDSRELPDVEYSGQQFGSVSFVNDLERPVFEKYVFLSEIKQWLRRQPEVAAALLSGSGSTVFGVVNDAADANKLADRARAELDPTLWTCVASTIADFAPAP
ncbi:MAG: 4-(cytidine 5'-diphospho)-2-C-methyl-D-erythritol kinase [Verrucomicrobiota bacterium]|nr:4-(cytidine 5'-diphospho)-2-C-methyl-D-erythritol kinase [Verrucomicrobiota bacterium]